MSVDLESARTPEGLRVYAVGDVHGYASLLKAMHDRIDADIAADPPQDWRIVHVGDYIDRGPDSKGVIDFLIARMAKDDRIIALRGNHDQGMLDFLDHPDPFSMFAQNGGLETARSYGVDLSLSDAASFEKTVRLFAAAVPSMHTRFLATTPFSTAFGDYFFCHAGIEPAVSLANQRPKTLMWIRDAFLRHSGLYEKIIVHGHTPQAAVELMANRINVDTGVYLRESLAALRLDGSRKTVITVR